MRYSERRVSLFLRAIHPDFAALRRYLVDEEFLSRSGGEYWRSGGTVAPSPEPQEYNRGRMSKPAPRPCPWAESATGARNTKGEDPWTGSWKLWWCR